MASESTRATSSGEGSSQVWVLDPGTQMGMLGLAVADLDLSFAFYTEAVGFTPLSHPSAAETSPREAILGAGDMPLLHLIEEPGARPWPQGGRSYTGLYHFAILVPTRADLGRWLRHWLSLGLPMPGQGDHLVSEALYLSDPDGNGIEVYQDRPRAQWTWDGTRVRMATDPVDIRGLLMDAERDSAPWQGLPPGTRLGHMHLQVADISQARAFYSDLLGFDVTAEMPSALFVSAGGYHHHIGMNSWHSRNAPTAPEGTAGLRFFTIDLPGREALAATVARLSAAGVPVRHEGGAAALTDPWGNILVLRDASDATTTDTVALRKLAREVASH